MLIINQFFLNQFFIKKIDYKIIFNIIIYLNNNILSIIMDNFATNSDGKIIYFNPIKLLEGNYQMIFTYKIDDEYDEILIDKGACVEFAYCAGGWYILSSDGLKQS